VENVLFEFDHKYNVFENGAIRLHVGKSKNNSAESELLMTCRLENYPVRDYLAIWSDMKTTIRNYDKLTHRNSKKDMPHLNKHAMHLVRLFLMGIDILEKGEIITYRENDLPLLMSIRNGQYMTKDGCMTQEFNELVGALEKRLKRAYNDSALPATPNLKRIEEWLIGVNEKIVKGEIKQYENF